MTENRANLSLLIHRAAFLIQRFRSLLESYVTTYYCEDGACNLIPAWTKEPGLGLEDLCYLLSGFLPNLATQSTKCRPTRPLPLSLLAYRTACLATQLNVCASDDSSFSDAPTWQHDPILFSNSTILTNLLKPLTELPDAWDSTTLKRDKHVVQFRRHLTPKKLHEIDRHSLVIYTLADAIETEKKTAPLVIDIGSGQGHLSRKLSLYHGLRVLNLEVDETHVRKASQFDEKTKSYLRKKIRTASSPSDHPNPEAVLRSPVSLSKRITNSTSSSELSNLISRSEAEGLLPNPSSNQPYPPPLVLLNGLHACGDLSTTVLRLFTEMDRACCAITVGCCYMKITATEIEDELSNIRGTRRCPQSSQQLWHPKSHCLQHYSLGLSYGILEAACHSIGDYLGRLRLAVDSGNQDHLLVHGYRALFELLMKRRCSACPYPDQIPVTRTIRCSVKRTTDMDFYTYSKLLLSRLAKVHRDRVTNATDRDNDQSDDHDENNHQRTLFAPFTREEVQHALDEIGPNLSPDKLWLPIVRYHVFRLMLAPVVEATILLDRLLRLQEMGFDACLLRVFDYTVSPRNIALIALRTGASTFGQTNS